MSLKSKLYKLGYASENLDELVHDVSSRNASAINNDGMDSQIAFLNEKGLLDEDILKALKEEHES